MFKDKQVFLELTLKRLTYFLCLDVWHILGDPPLKPVISKYKSASKQRLSILDPFQEKVLIPEISTTTKIGDKSTQPDNTLHSILVHWGQVNTTR